MPRDAHHGTAFLLAAFVLAGCGLIANSAFPATERNAEMQDAAQPKGISGRTAKPVPPLSLPTPSPLPDRLEGKDLKAVDARSLLARANQAMANEDYPRAAVFQYWYVQKSKTGQYNLACFLARIGQTDPAFYWLQQAAIDVGVDTQHAQRDEDLVSLRRDPRWQKVRQYMDECNRYFEAETPARAVLILPRGYRKATPIPAVVWMHGLGSRPEGFVNENSQNYADAMKVALIGVSGTKPRGPRSFVWAEDVEKDAKRVRDALDEVSDRVTLKRGHVITLGFSQGAQLGLEVAVRYPEDFAGAIALSPGALPHLKTLKPSPLLARRGFVLCCGANENPGNVQLTAFDADWLREAKARVIHKPYPGVSAHAFPPDFGERFPEWVDFILKTRGE
jgi:predicted esterase